MLIDCDRCAVRGPACGDCVVGVLLGVPAVPRGAPAARPVERPSGAAELHLDAPERRALEVLADHGLIPRLRLVSEPQRGAPRSDHPPGRRRDAG